jgi:hypothetical protein
MIVEYILGNLNGVVFATACAALAYLVISGRLSSFYEVVESKEQAKPKTAPNGMPIAEIPAMLRPHRDGPKTLGIAPGDLLPLPEGPVKNARDRRISPELLSQCRLDGKALWLGCYSQARRCLRRLIET